MDRGIRLVIADEKIEKDFEKFKRKAEYMLRNEKYDQALTYIELAAYIMYHTSIKHVDRDLEHMLWQIGTQIMSVSCEKGKKSKDKILFYDGFGYNLRGLACIYIKALVAAGIEVLYLSNNNKQEDLLEELLKNPQNEVMYFNDESHIEKMEKIAYCIEKYRPTHIFIYTTPFDASAISAFYGVPKYIKKILINLSNNVFWLGADVADYVFEFSNYWYQFSKQIRRIPEEKLVLLPYYPVIKDFPLASLPFECQNKKLIVSGGSEYKVSGSNVFFRIVEYILRQDENTIFLYLGDKEPSKLKRMSEKDRFKNRIFFEHERKDFFQIIRKSEFYLSTYPISGGLMTQYAAAAGKLPITYTELDENGKALRELLIDSQINFVFSDLKDLFCEIDKILNDCNYLNGMDVQLKNSVMTEKKFNDELKLFFLSGETSFQPVDYEVHTEYGVTCNILKENQQYYRLFFQKKRWKILLRNFPVKFCVGLGIAIKDKLFN